MYLTIYLFESLKEANEDEEEEFLDQIVEDETNMPDLFTIKIHPYGV